MKGIPCTEQEVKEAEATFKAMEEIRRKKNEKTKRVDSRTKSAKKPL